jgi:nitrogen fixation/metabolism regulation signal transduction histidine kinase
MLARDEIRVSMGLLLIVQLTTSFGAIGLLTRMGPAIGLILEENMVSIQATESMLDVMATHEGSVTDRRVAFHEALTRAERNITIEAERPVLVRIRSHSGNAFDGDTAARAALVSELRELSRINQSSMEDADKSARSLGTAGAWAAILLGMLGFILSLLIFRRMQERVLNPVQDIHDVLVDFDRGETLRRTSIHRAPSEIASIGQHLNAMLDSHNICQVEPWTALASQDRALLLAILDGAAQPSMLWDTQGQLHATNAAAEALAPTTLAAARDKLRAALLAATADAPPAVDGWSILRLGDAGWRTTSLKG